jgi:hypothetical protein
MYSIGDMRSLEPYSSWALRVSNLRPLPCKGGTDALVRDRPRNRGTSWVRLSTVECRPFVMQELCGWRLRRRRRWLRAERDRLLRSSQARRAKGAERSREPWSYPEVARPPKVTPGRPGGPAARRSARSGAGPAPPLRITDPAPSRSADNVQLAYTCGRRATRKPSAHTGLDSSGRYQTQGSRIGSGAMRSSPRIMRTPSGISPSTRARPRGSALQSSRS